MKTKSHRKRLKRRLKRAAATMAGAAMMTAALLPGLPAATAHASAAPAPEQPYSVVQQVVKTPKGFYTVQKKVPKSAVQQTAAPEQRTEQAKPDKKAPDKVKQVQAKPAKTKNDNKEQEDTKAVTTGAKAPGNFEDVLQVKATAYAAGPHDNGKWGEKTHLGTTVRPGVIAVDPNVIPLGSRVYLEFPDGTGTYAVAEDTGGAIKGNRIDIAMSSVDKAYDFGIKNVKVYVLGK